MDALEYQGGVKKYLQLPLYMIIVFAIGTIFIYFYNTTIGVIATVIVIVYGIVTLVLYRKNVKTLAEEVVTIATSYATMQKEFLEKFQLPYALLDAGGHFLWQNENFQELSGKEKHYSKSITTIFPEITREWLEKKNDRDFDCIIKYNGKVYDALFTRVNLYEALNKDEVLSQGESQSGLFTLLLIDISSSEELRAENEEQKICVALLDIDNYDETVESIDNVKRSLLTAIIDRKINRYFQEADAIIRKTDDDKYFIIFQYKYLSKLEENKFSILEDMKATKAGNDKELTVSIGIGIHGNSYQKNAEYARTAIDLAMGRGGSQVVIKDNANISYYGVRGKEIEKNTRVKARVKAEALRELMETKDKIFVMGHKISDADAIGAAIGVFCAAKHLDKECHIVLNTITSSLKPIIELFDDDEKYPYDMFVQGDTALEEIDANSLLVVVDTNRPSYTECPELLEKTKSIVVIDHHRQGNERIENATLSYIESYSSSSCEMIAEVLQYFSENIHLTQEEAESMYAGILIDTNNFLTKTGVRTFEAAAYLKRCGVNVTHVRKLLREDMTAYKARADIIRNAEVYRNAFAIAVCDGDNIDSPTIVGAQASNELLNIVGIKASFVLTNYRGKVYVSSRSIDEIDVQGIMERLGGGGHQNVAGAQIEDASIEEVRRHIKEILDDMIDHGEIKLSIMKN